MNKRGFTLIELLAVIVILAIIALIATPIVLNIIKDSKESAQLRSAEMYLKGVETSVATAILDEQNITDGTYPIMSNGNVCLGTITDNKCKEEETLVVEMNGEKPTSGTVKIASGKITDIAFTYLNGKTIVKNAGKLAYEDESSKVKTYANGEEVYFDVVKGIGCTIQEYDETNSKTGYNGINNKIYTTTYPYEYSISEKEQLQSSCLKFYVFNDNGGDTVNLLLDHNTSLYVAWNASKNNISGPSKVLEQLKVDTDNWKGTQVLSNYLLFQGENYANYSVDYSDYRARLITAGEIAKITNNELFDETKSSSNFYFDSNLNTPSDNCQKGNTTDCKYGWLYDRTKSNCKDYGCLNNSNTEEGSYWTSTAVSGITTDSWRIGVTGLYYGGYVIGTQYAAGPGVRPVIEVLKSKLN